MKQTPFAFFVSCPILQVPGRADSRQNSVMGMLLGMLIFKASPVTCNIIEAFSVALFLLLAFSSSVSPCCVFLSSTHFYVFSSHCDPLGERSQFFSHFLWKGQLTFPWSHLFFLLWPMHLPANGLLSFLKQIVSLRRILFIRF